MSGQTTELLDLLEAARRALMSAAYYTACSCAGSRDGCIKCATHAGLLETLDLIDRLQKKQADEKGGA